MAIDKYIDVTANFALETHILVSVFVNLSMSNKINQQTMEKSNFHYATGIASIYRVV